MSVPNAEQTRPPRVRPPAGPMLGMRKAMRASSWLRSLRYAWSVRVLPRAGLGSVMQRASCAPATQQVGPKAGRTERPQSHGWSAPGGATTLHPNKMPSGRDPPRGPGIPPPQGSASFRSEAVFRSATSQSPLACREVSLPSYQIILVPHLSVSRQDLQPPGLLRTISFPRTRIAP